MDITSIIAPLNDAQREAVTAPSQAMLILAGAGSGKTRVLVHRIVWQIQVNGLSPQSILAVTFTNKAANEMRGRVENLLDSSASSMWIGTFHGIAHRLLRRHAEQARLPKDFQVLDSNDQQRLIKRILADLKIDDKELPAKEVQWFINEKKDAALRSFHLVGNEDKNTRRFLRIYQEYEAACERSGVVDFSELLLRVYELFRDNDNILQQYQQRFSQIHVDEFQDTNHLQYAWLTLLSPNRDNIFVVGDDDQAIYGWRGAKIENIYNFKDHYPTHQTIKLEQNYRSSGAILKAANHIIANNKSRLGKELWTDLPDGEKISVYGAFSDVDEAKYVVDRIRSWVEDGNKRVDVAILYRSNAQSRQFEEQLMLTKTPYRVFGGLRFFDRAEIKNALAYLRLLANRHDDASFDRVVNTPTRGIGLKTIDEIRQLANSQQISLWMAAQCLIDQKLLPNRAGNALFYFLDLIEQLAAKTAELPLGEKVQIVIENSGLMAFYGQDKVEKSAEKIENLKELVNAANLFKIDVNSDADISELSEFLSHAALESAESQANEFDDCVQLMTLHTAKGLEFRLVFLVGLEDGLFPSQQSIYDAGKLEEERRLCYVGITRAREKLYITHAEKRLLYGRETPASKSRFLRELPAELLEEVRPKREVSRPMTAKSTSFSITNLPKEMQSDSRYRLGQRVEHESFGAGIILKMEGEGKTERALIKFSDDSRWLMTLYTKLHVI
ncbi:MAG: DNA helicase II [Methylococcales bacterium]|jgi:DNA helicase-2/ATP-dependent DNA helicase PcrA|nr:DNA helicase II [Methylococcales bacterium]